MLEESFPSRPTDFPATPLSPAELERLKILLRRYPGGAPDELAELNRLYERIGATELMALMGDPQLRRRLRRFDPPADLRWDLLVAWSAVGAAMLLLIGIVLLSVLA